MSGRVGDLFGADAARLDETITERLAGFRSSTSRFCEEHVAGQHQASAMPAGGMPAEEYIEYLFRQVVPSAVRTHRSRFIGHMTSALPDFLVPLGRVITALNQNVVKIETSNGFTHFERQALAMMHRLVYGRDERFYAAHTQDPDSSLGMMVSGGTLGNLAALWCARNHRFAAQKGFAGVEAEGLAATLQHFGFRRAVIIGSSLMHYSMRKAADILGIGERNLIRVPATRESRIDVDRLADQIERCRRDDSCVLALVGIAGTTETGAVDPLGEMADLATAYGTHLHVDAAWGGPVLFSEKHRGLLAGIERADSVVIDGHKQLYLPMGLGVVVLRNPQMAKAIEKTADYIIRAGSSDLGRRTLEGSRPATAVYLHSALHIIGQRGYEALVDGGIARCRFMAAEIRRRDEFELLAEPQLNILVYRYVPAALRSRAAAGLLTARDNVAINELNVRLQDRQRQEGDGFVSRTVLANTRYGAEVPIVSLRSVLANPLTTQADICDVLDEQVRLSLALDVSETRLSPFDEHEVYEAVEALEEIDQVAPVAAVRCRSQ
ncbi:MAG: putative pyridoxal-dependent aspartate 1-decarboxylase [Myxococcales bacterium]|nr:putative pyridoxal-dependent aspartate 1-decarboxylase [Myxococcales bacterium]